MKIIQILFGVLIIAVSARITIDVGPIPVSGQSIAVLLVGYFLRSSLGAIALILYLLLGLIGLPVFADGASGLAVLKGGSGGFVWGFILGAYLLGRLAELGWGTTLLKSLLAMFLGTAVIVMCGLIQLSYLYDIPRALEYGLYPFIWGALIKIILGALVIYGYERFSARKKEGVS